jgi:hypothetical protein
LETYLFRLPKGATFAPAPRPGATFADALIDAHAECTWSAHSLTENGARSTTAFDPAITGGHGPRLVYTPAIDASGAIKLQYALTLDEGDDAGAPMTTTLIARDRQRIVLGSAAANAAGEKAIAVVVPYIIRQKEDLADIFACKRARRDAFLRGE